MPSTTVSTSPADGATSSDLHQVSSSKMARQAIQQLQAGGNASTTHKGASTADASTDEPVMCPLLGDVVSPELPAVPVPAKPLLKPSVLKENCFILPGNKVFIDKVLPPINEPLSECTDFPMDYFVALHKLASAPGVTHPAYTPNHIGARIPLQHTRLNIPRWRHHLIGYEGAEVVQFLEYGWVPYWLSRRLNPITCFNTQEPWVLIPVLYLPGQVLDHWSGERRVGRALQGSSFQCSSHQSINDCCQEARWAKECL